MTQAAGRLRRAELLSSVGAGILGAAVALLFASTLRPFALPLLVLGLLAHSWGMLMKHRLERQAAAELPRWAEWLYWVCWVLLAGLGVYIVVRTR